MFEVFEVVFEVAAWMREYWCDQSVRAIYGRWMSDRLE